jgi:hypothetical protein
MAERCLRATPWGQFDCKGRAAGPLWLRSRLLLAIVAAAGLAASAGCDAESWDVVATQAIPRGAVRVWAPSGRLHQGLNPLLVDVVGPAAAEPMVPPRLTFEKPQAGAGFAVRSEAILRQAGRGKFRGRVEFAESGAWHGRLEVLGETVSMDVAVE